MTNIHIHAPRGFVRRHVWMCSFEMQRTRHVSVSVPYALTRRHEGDRPVLYYETTVICCSCGWTADTERGPHRQTERVRRKQESKAKRLWASAGPREETDAEERRYLFGGAA